MTDEKTKRKNKKRFYPNNKETASQQKETKPQPPANIEKKLQELQAYINGNFHTS